MRDYKMQKKIIAVAVASAITLTACGPDTPTEEQFRNSVVSQAAMDSSNRDKIMAEKIQAQMKLLDPSIVGVDPAFADNLPTVSIHRQTADGAYESWTMPPKDYERLIAEISPQLRENKSDDDYGIGSVVAAGAAGMLAGALINNMMNANNRTRIPDQASLTNYRNGARSVYNRLTVARQGRKFDNEREKERRGGGGYVSPFINQNNANTTYTNSAGYSGKSFRPNSTSSSSSYSAPSSPSRSSSSGQAFSSGARGSVSG